MKAKTGQGPTEPSCGRSYIENLFCITKLVSDAAVVEKIEADFNSCNIRYGDMKTVKGKIWQLLWRPSGTGRSHTEWREAYLKKWMEQGAEKSLGQRQANHWTGKECCGLELFLKTKTPKPNSKKEAFTLKHWMLLTVPEFKTYGKE